MTSSAHMGVGVSRNQDDMRTNSIQGLTKRWSLGCVNSRPAARGSQDVGIVQLRDPFLADPCIF